MHLYVWNRFDAIQNWLKMNVEMSMGEKEENSIGKHMGARVRNFI